MWSKVELLIFITTFSHGIKYINKFQRYTSTRWALIGLIIITLTIPTLYMCCSLSIFTGTVIKECREKLIKGRARLTLYRALGQKQIRDPCNKFLATNYIH